ncbi:MAG TPA: hypothetical protein VJQ54_23545 [Candidatus Sulfotelmatobacter sp.]|nr:hypothetical protein [Candidatus Sulfotelmatobacter sp.]
MRTFKLQNYPISKLQIQERVHGKYSKTQQRRTKKNKKSRAQEAQSRKAVETEGLSARVEEAQG